MAKAVIVWTDESVRWLQEIGDHIAQDSPVAAERTIDGIYQKVQMLGDFPELGFRYPLPGRDDVRVLLYGHYRIAYMLTERTSIHILGVFHAALDIDRYFPEVE